MISKRRRNRLRHLGGPVFAAVGQAVSPADPACELFSHGFHATQPQLPARHEYMQIHGTV